MSTWREGFQSPYLASWDLDGLVQLTIDKVEVKQVQLMKLETKVVATFKEAKLPSGAVCKPMLLNATNCKLLHSAVKSPNVELWSGLKIELGVKPNKGRIGEAMGLAIIRVLSANDMPVNVKSELKVGDANWDKVLDYVTSNKHLGMNIIVKNLETKYTIETLVKKELSKHI